MRRKYTNTWRQRLLKVSRSDVPQFFFPKYLPIFYRRDYSKYNIHNSSVSLLPVCLNGSSVNDVTY